MINKEIKDKLDLMIGLEASMREVHDELNKHVVEVAKRYIVAAHDKNRGYGYPTRDCASFYWTIEEGNVEVTWEETWRYGGHDAGSFTVPAKFIWDEEALVAYEAKRAQEKADKQAAEEAAARQKEIEQLKKLQEKYPDETCSV